MKLYRQLASALALAGLLTAVACPTAAARPKPDQASLAADMVVPFKLVDSRIYVDAYVDGRGPFRFLVDTGADGMGRADTTLVRDLGLPVTGTTENSDGVNISTILTVTAKSLRLGNLERHNVQLLSRDYNRRATAETSVSGIIGRGFFQDGTLTIDFPARVLKFSTRTRLKPNDKDVVAFGEPIVIPFAIGNRKFEGHIDTGSTLTMHLPMSDLNQVKASPLQAAGQGHRANTIFNLFRSTLQEPVRISGLTLDGLTVITSKEATWINIGGAVLQQGVLVLDQSRKLFALRPSAADQTGKAVD